MVDLDESGTAKNVKVRFLKKSRTLTIELHKILNNLTSPIFKHFFIIVIKVHRNLICETQNFDYPLPFINANMYLLKVNFFIILVVKKAFKNRRR